MCDKQLDIELEIRERRIDLIFINSVALSSMIVPIIVFMVAFILFNPMIAKMVFVVIVLTLWFMPGGNCRCLHMFIGGWQPFIVSYPVILYLDLERLNELKKTLSNFQKAR